MNRMNSIELDNNLLRRIKNDPEVFIEVYDKYYFDVLNFMNYRVSHTQIAEDLTSDVFRKAFENIFKVRKLKNPLFSWIYAISRNTVYSHYRKKKVMALEHIEEIVDEGTSQHKKMVHAENAEDMKAEVQKMNEVIADMPQKLHEVITLFYYEGYKAKEIAETLKISLSAVKTRLSRARVYIKKRYEE